MKLTKRELKQFNDVGYVVKPGVFRAADLEPIQAALTRMVDEQARAAQRDGELKDLFENEPFDTRLAKLAHSSPTVWQRFYARILGKGGGGFNGPEMFQMITHPPLLGCIESIIGPEIVGSSVYRIRPKLPTWERGEVPWHQDAGYTLRHCDSQMIVTCWVPLVDATLANGCLYVVPGVHRHGVVPHYTGGHGGYLEIPIDELPDANRAVPVEMQAGGVLFLTNKTPHASFENSTDKVRWSVDLRYQGADAPNNVGERPEDYTPEREPVTMACYPPEADFVIRSPSHPEREVRTAAEFHRLRDIFEKGRPFFPGRGWTPLAERAAKTP